MDAIHCCSKMFVYYMQNHLPPTFKSAVAAELAVCAQFTASLSQPNEADFLRQLQLFQLCHCLQN